MAMCLEGGSSSPAGSFGQLQPPILVGPADPALGFCMDTSPDGGTTHREFGQSTARHRDITQMLWKSGGTTQRTSLSCKNGETMPTSRVLPPSNLSVGTEAALYCNGEVFCGRAGEGEGTSEQLDSAQATLVAEIGRLQVRGGCIDMLSYKFYTQVLYLFSASSLVCTKFEEVKSCS